LSLQGFGGYAHLITTRCLFGKTIEISVSLVCHRGVAPFLNMKFILHVRI